MPNYSQYVMRLGEFGVQALIEQQERYEGIRHHALLPLEDRWEILMRKPANNNGLTGAMSCKM